MNRKFSKVVRIHDYMEKPELVKKTETIHTVDSYDLDDFIREVYGIKSECQQTEEWGNDTKHRFKIEPLTKDIDKTYWETIKSTKSIPMYDIRIVLCGMCMEGKIEAGVYLISVSW